MSALIPCSEGILVLVGSCRFLELDAFRASRARISRLAGSSEGSASRQSVRDRITATRAQMVPDARPLDPRGEVIAKPRDKRRAPNLTDLGECLVIDDALVSLFFFFLAELVL